MRHTVCAQPGYSGTRLFVSCLFPRDWLGSECVLPPTEDFDKCLLPTKSPKHSEVIQVPVRFADAAFMTCSSMSMAMIHLLRILASAGIGLRFLGFLYRMFSRC